VDSPTEIQQQLDNVEDTLKRTRLRTMQRVAGGLLVFAFLLFLLARSQSGAHPAWGYLAAFAEAAMIGAVADWFAVVALFRHPLGIPVWHTAIIPNSKDDIARNLGGFVENHFITEESIAKRIRQANPAGLISSWLLAPDRASQLGHSLAKALKTVLNSLDDSQISQLLKESANKQLAQLDISATTGKVVDTLVAEGKHQDLLDCVLQGIGDYLGDEENHPQAISFVISALGVEKAIYKAGTTALGPRVLRSLNQSLNGVLDDADHPLRARFNGWVENFVLRLKDDPQWHEAIAQYQRETLSGTQVQELLGGLWGLIKSRLLNDLTRDDPAIAEYIATLTRKIGEALSKDAKLSDWLNSAIETGSAELVRKHRGEVGRFIETQLSLWTREEMTHRIELVIGRDLQFIRINGTLVGGLVGLAIYAITQVI
jgi:uncharacterized membrane-anchored protein YjiN (DUF445 family)